MSEDETMPVAGRYSSVLRYVRETPWAILPETLAVITDLLRYRAGGDRLSRAEIAERIGPHAATKGIGAARAGSVAVIPLQGVIVHRADMFSDVSGAASLDKFQARFREAMADPGVGSIIINIDSPGGTVAGVMEMAAEVLAARDTKRIIAVADTLAASAAYWIASAAGEIVVAPSGEVGSIGVIAAHEDLSAALEQQGIKVTLVSAGKYKAEASPLAALGEEARAAIQARVDEFYGAFIAAVAKGRGATPAAVRGGFGEGRVVGAAEAIKTGMADRIGTLDETLARLLGRKPAGASAQGLVPSLEVRRRRLQLASCA